MLFSEAKELDRFGVYNGYMTIGDAERCGKIPPSFIGVFTKHCECGSELIISDNRKNVQCCNSKCYVKMGHAMADMFSNFRLKDIGAETCKVICRYCISNEIFKVPTHTEILSIGENSDLRFVLGAKWYTLLSHISIIKETRMTFATMVSKIAIPGFQDTAQVVFGDIKNSFDLAEELKKSDIDGFLMSKGVMSATKFKNLQENLLTIVCCEKSLNYKLEVPGIYTKEICITGSVSVNGVRITKDTFVELCNQIGIIEGVRIFTIKNTSAMKSVEHIIADTPSNSRKYLVGLERESMGEKGVLITAQDYIKLLREEAKVCSEMIQKMKSQ